MFKTTHRPAPMSTRPVGPVGRKPLPDGAVRWSRTWLDKHGRPQSTGYEVPVDDLDRRTDHIRYTCPGNVEIKDDNGKWQKQPCDQDVWLLPGAKPSYCSDHGAQLQPQDKPGRAPLLPWRDVWHDTGQLVAVPAGVGGVVGGAGVVAAGMPLWALSAGTVPAAAGVWAATRWWLTRQAVVAGKLDPDSEVTGGRKRATIGRRARTAGYCAAAAGCWMAGAAALGMDPTTPGGLLSWLSLSGLTAAGSYPWRRYIRELNNRLAPAPATAGTPDVEPVDMLTAEVTQIWETRVDKPNGALPETSLAEVSQIKGGWTATIVPDVPGAVDPDRFSQASTVRKVAGAYRVSVADVSIEMNPQDASTATIWMQRESPLYWPRIWPGTTETCDWTTGLMRIGTFADDSPVYYRWWNDGGPVHELISGCTGSGKSELTQMLLLAGLHSGGLVLDRVIDPQSGQSFGELQDHVDWFAPNIAEAQLSLLDTVKEMRRRNRVFSRRRQKTWKPCREFPLIVVTIDEAHEVLADPICLALVEKLAKMARKCGIKLRIITQVASVTEIGNSTPIKDALLAGQLWLFRTGSNVSSQVALGGALDVEPHNLPSEWPKGSPNAGKTTAGIGYLVGAERRSMLLRTNYTGPEEDLPAWLYDQDGQLITTPGAPSPEMVAESGPLWGNRQERVAAHYDSDPNDSDILPGEVVAAMVARAAGKPPPAPAPAESAGDTSAKQLVLRTAVARADNAGLVKREAIAEHVRRSDGSPMPPRTLTNALSELIGNRLLERCTDKSGWYQLTSSGRAACQAETDAAVEQMLATAGSTAEGV